MARSVAESAAPPQSIFALQKRAGGACVAQLVGTLSGGEATAQAQHLPPAAAPASDGATEVELYPILDYTANNQRMVTAAEYENERTRLGRLLRYLVHAIPEDAKTVLEDYPFVEIKEMYEAVLDDLKFAGEYYAKGRLIPARRFARWASSYTDIEPKAHKRLMEESAYSYVGKRVGMAVIGFFEGAAEALVGLIDAGAGLVGQHPDLEGKIKKRYDEISQVYSAATGIDSTLTGDRTTGRIGGKVAENLATGRALGGLGKVGTAINATQAAAAAKNAVETVVDLRAQGKSWGDIFSNPVLLSEFAGAVAGAAGVGASAFPKAKEILDGAGLILSASQTAALATALAQYQDDPNLSAAQNLEKKEDLIVGVLTSAGSTIDVAHSAIKGAHTAGEAAEAETTRGAHSEPKTGADEAKKTAAGESTPEPAGTARGERPGKRIGESNPSQARELVEQQAAKGEKPEIAAGHEVYDTPEGCVVCSKPCDFMGGKYRDQFTTGKRAKYFAKRFYELEQVAERSSRKAAEANLVRELEAEAKVGKAVDQAFADLEKARIPQQGELKSGGRKGRPESVLDINGLEEGQLASVDLVYKVKNVLGKTIAEAPKEVLNAWRAAKADVLKKNGPLTKSNYGALYKSTQSKFFENVRANNRAKGWFEENGLTFTSTKSGAPTIDLAYSGERYQVAIQLDHMAPKGRKGTQNWEKALDPDHIQFLTGADNWLLNEIERVLPQLKRNLKKK
jgi:hypothetical protein